MGLMKCPYCARRFASLDASREHVDATHHDAAPGNGRANAA